jgi:hypothetical protein
MRQGADVVVQALTLASDNAILEEGFNWAVHKANQFVVTGQKVPFEKWEGHPAIKQITAQPAYWAGYFDRSAYYSRDFAHQASGAQLVGLAEENFRMFEAFAKASTSARAWYSYWAINFDNRTPLGIDYRNDANFVREVPAQFELVEKAYKQYLWSGDERYLGSEMMAFYAHAMNEFVALHDSNQNGVAEGDPNGGGIFAGSATYNERGRHLLESGDSIGSQYQATLAYAGFLRARGDEAGYGEWMQKADALRDYFNRTWSVKAGTSLYVNALTLNDVKEADFGKESSWFMPMKLITEPGARNNAYLDFISQNLGNGIGSANAPRNIEAYTYLPDTFFAFNRADEAFRWMSYILGRRDFPHERAAQGTNGDYPEISFTFVSHTVEGMMGIEPDARLNKLRTIPRLPGAVGEVGLEHLRMGCNGLKVTHTGNTKTAVTNTAGNPNSITWMARFYGTHNTIGVDGVEVPAAHGTLNGEPIRYVGTVVAPGQTVVAEALV